jgi:hypothetical protein
VLLGHWYECQTSWHTFAAMTILWSRFLRWGLSSLEESWLELPGLLHGTGGPREPKCENQASRVFANIYLGRGALKDSLLTWVSLFPPISPGVGKSTACSLSTWQCPRGSGDGVGWWNLFTLQKLPVRVNPQSENVYSFFSFIKILFKKYP